MMRSDSDDDESYVTLLLHLSMHFIYLSSSSIYAIHLSILFIYLCNSPIYLVHLSIQFTYLSSSSIYLDHHRYPLLYEIDYS